MGSFFGLSLPGLSLSFGKTKGCHGHRPPICRPHRPPMRPPMFRPHRPPMCGPHRPPMRPPMGGCCGGPHPMGFGGGIRGQLHQIKHMLKQMLGMGGMGMPGLGNTGINNGVVNNIFIMR